MRSLLLIALIVASAPSAAEPPKPAPAARSPQEQRPAVLMLASNDQPRPAGNEAVQHGQPPANHRIARVTTCRCGDPQPASDSDPDSEQ